MTAYVLWGLFPFYFALLDSVSPLEVVAHRVIWSFVLLSIILLLTKSWSQVRDIVRNRRAAATLAAAAVFLAFNWGIYVYSVATNQLVEASLGYFINPLVSVALGVLLIKERLRRLQWVAVGIAGIAVLELTWSYGQVPLIGLGLAFSFGIYGLLKKVVGAKALPALTIETGSLLPVALIYLVSVELLGIASFASTGWEIGILLILLGPVTTLPLLAFGAAATRIPLSTLGLMQYFTPTFIFLVGIFVFGEQMTPSRWFGFGLIWIGLVLFSVDALRAARSGRMSPLTVAEPD
ncbi:MAG: EamA family transporter RarD [Actinomycetales bacterium]|nr:EamA family transporter RarD [Actinomycetales bacterium]